MTQLCATWFRSFFLSYEILPIPLRRRPLSLQLFLREKEGGRTGGTTDSLLTSEKNILESGLQGNRYLSDVPLNVMVAGGAKEPGCLCHLPIGHPSIPFTPIPQKALHHGFNNTHCTLPPLPYYRLWDVSLLLSRTTQETFLCKS